MIIYSRTVSLRKGMGDSMEAMIGLEIEHGGSGTENEKEESKRELVDREWSRKRVMNGNVHQC